MTPVSLYAVGGVTWATLSQMGFDTQPVWEQITAWAGSIGG